MRLSGVDSVIRDFEGEVLGASASKKTEFVDSFMVEDKLQCVHLSLHMKWE